ncbi:hypothetical protein Golax_021711 [Gossypium laxum]|uniref:Uncharacterized protein n=1 Tax=Gossypium laxum TaxID=34288 RepID=A0A7J9ALZ5_9ROSI|nr:hypothetical protein [Gossypium laxum]
MTKAVSKMEGKTDILIHWRMH